MAVLKYLLTILTTLLPSSGGQIGPQMMMTTILSEHSMKSMGYVKWAEALVMVKVEYCPRSYRSRAKAQGQDPTMLWLGRA